MKTALQKIEDQALQEIKDYSTGKKYFVSKFQDKVRKSNIKAKKRLIGTGNAGALSGTGPLEEIEKLKGGKGDNKKDSDFDPKQLAIGIKHELEHTKDKKIAKEIAKDHLSEDPKYYQKIAKIEEQVYQLDEGIMQFLGLQQTPKKAQEQTQEEYINYSQPDEARELYIGAFPSIHTGELDDAKNKFDVIINMSTDVVSIFGNNEKYKEYKKQNFIIDDFAVDDVDFTEAEMEILKSNKEEDLQKIIELEDKIEKENAKIGSAADKAAKLVNSEKKRVLIVCSEGRNRSAVTTIMAMIILGKTNQEAYNAVRTARKITFNRMELKHANLRQTRPKKINDEILSFGRMASSVPNPHGKYRNLVGISERLKQMLAKLIQEEYNKLIKESK